MSRVIRFPAGRSSTSTPGLRAVVGLLVRLDEAESAVAAREQRRGDLLEVRGDRRERLVEAPVHRLRELVA